MLVQADTSSGHLHPQRDRDKRAMSGAEWLTRRLVQLSGAGLGGDKAMGEEVWAESPQSPRTLRLWRGGEVGSTGWGRGGGSRAKLSLGPQRSDTRACRPGAEFWVGGQTGAVLAPRPTYPALCSSPLPSQCPWASGRVLSGYCLVISGLGCGGAVGEAPEYRPRSPQSLFFPASCCPTTGAALTKWPGPQSPRSSEMEGGLFP